MQCCLGAKSYVREGERERTKENLADCRDKRWSRGAETKVCGCSTLNSPVLVRQEQSIAIRTCLQDKAHYSIRDSAKGLGSGAGYRG